MPQHTRRAALSPMEGVRRCLPNTFDVGDVEALTLFDAMQDTMAAFGAAAAVVGEVRAGEWLRDLLLAAIVGEAPAGARRSRVKLSLAARTRVMERCGFRCPCGSVVDLAVDHVLPVARGGSSGEWNLQVLCAPCNRAKSDR